jgi:molybdenum ABC transporter molybdate-binding protein
MLEAFNTEYPTNYEVSYGGSGDLAAQIRHGAPFDLVFFASFDAVVRLAADGLLQSEVVTGPLNSLVLVRHPDSVLGVDSRLGIGGLGVPAGDYARKWISTSLDAYRAHELVEFPHVRSVLAAVESRTCAAGFVYSTDIVGRTDLVVIAADQPATTAVSYGLGVLTTSSQAVPAAQLAAWLMHQESTWRHAGFTMPVSE